MTKEQFQKILQDIQAAAKAVQDNPSLAKSLEEQFATLSKAEKPKDESTDQTGKIEETPPREPESVSLDKKPQDWAKGDAEAQEQMEKEELDKDDKPHKAGSPEDSAHDVAEEDSPLQRELGHLASKQMKERFIRHLRSLKDKSQHRSEHNREAGMEKSDGCDYKSMKAEMLKMCKKEMMEKSSLKEKAKKVGGAIKTAAKFVGRNTLEDAKTIGRIIKDPKNTKQHLNDRLNTFFNDHAPKEDKEMSKSEKFAQFEALVKKVKSVHGIPGKNRDLHSRGINSLVSVAAPKFAGDAKEKSLQGLKVRRGDMKGAKEAAREILNESKAIPKPKLPKSEESLDKVHMPHYGNPKMSDMGVMVRESRAPHSERYPEHKIKGSADYLRFKNAARQQGMSESQSKQAALDPKKLYNHMAKQKAKQSLAEQKAMPKPNLPKTEKMAKKQKKAKK